MPRVTQLVRGSARLWVVENEVHVKPQSRHTELSSELATVALSLPVPGGT